ncbi:predicted protein [Fibroporia radiculosa]|uniref:Uncharacterized protein n=1 Tax=Fibroporia radiculosa TaxID=599839 RepID=J7S670_9APHY|nr:predicted protein [Fibroporia radiculosa]
MVYMCYRVVGDKAAKK